MKKSYLFASTFVVTSLLVCGGVKMVKATMSETVESEGIAIAKPTPIVMDVNSKTAEAHSTEGLNLEDSNEEMNYYLHTEETR